MTLAMARENESERTHRRLHRVRVRTQRTHNILARAYADDDFAQIQPSSFARFRNWSPGPSDLPARKSRPARTQTAASTVWSFLATPSKSMSLLSACPGSD